MRKDNRDYAESGERASGDLLTYFILHNLLSVLFFFLFTIAMGIYAEQVNILGFSWIQVIGYIISSDFWELMVFQVFPISVISSVLGRITGFYAIKIYYIIRDRKLKTRRTTKRWSELSKGINRMGIKFFITALLTSFIYSIGLIVLLSFAIFGEATLLPLVLIYTALKIGTYFFVRWFVGSKL